MLKFKVGDRVRCLQDSGSGGLLEGQIYVVSDIEMGGTWLRFEADSLGRLNGWSSEYFELESNEDEPFITTLPPQPAKRVLKDYILTTKNIHAIIRMNVEDYKNEGVAISIADQYMEAVDIAELITFLTKVHEVLKENENAA